jgi:predicted membrane-bound mannosyltransferase
MALVAEALKAELLRAFQMLKVSRAPQAAQLFAAAYFTYAVTASSFYGPFVPTGTEQPRLRGMLQAALSAPMGSALACAQAWGTGIQLFWVGAVFGTGVATVLTGLPLLVGGVAGVLSNSRNETSTAAQLLATVIDAGTRTLLIGGGSGPVPVT